ncbi:MAG TPA: cytochrome c [Allosphingosinicella sp.]|nr:cytochrome c [Allosphingosinicella sp.]
MRRLSLLALPFLLASCATTTDHNEALRAAAAEPSPAELVGARQAMMHMAATLLFQSVMPAAKIGSDVKAQQHAADGLARFGHSLPGLFPPGSATPESRALPAIWANKADFDAKGHAFGAAAERLGELAAAGDTAGFAAQAPLVAKACGGCHTLYRSEEKKP